MNRRLENLHRQVRDPSSSDSDAELRYLLDRLLKRERLIGALTPDQSKSIASRVRPGRKDEREVLSRIGRLAKELHRKEANWEARGGNQAGVD